MDTKLRVDTEKYGPQIKRGALDLIRREIFEIVLDATDSHVDKHLLGRPRHIQILSAVPQPFMVHVGTE